MGWKTILISSLKVLGLHKYFDRSVLSGLIYALLWRSCPSCWDCHLAQSWGVVSCLVDFTLKGRNCPPSFYVAFLSSRSAVLLQSIFRSHFRLWDPFQSFPSSFSSSSMDGLSWSVEAADRSISNFNS